MDDPMRSAEPAFEVVAPGGLGRRPGRASDVLAALPADFPAAIVVVQHLDPNHPSLLAEILGRRTGLLVRQAAEGDRLRPGASSSPRRTGTCWSTATARCR